MGRRRKVVIAPTKFSREYEAILPDGKKLERGDILKVVGEHGLRFKFDALVTNTETGAQWIDCFEVYKMRAGVLRAFTADRIKPMPKRRRRRRASRTTDS